MSLLDLVIALGLVFLAGYLVCGTIILAKGDREPSLFYLVSVSFAATMIGLVGFAYIYRGIVQ